MTKFKIGMVTRYTPHLVMVIFSDEVVKINAFYRYLVSVVSGNKYLPRDGKENVLSTTITTNITMSR